MSDKMRWRYGETNPVMAAVGSATVIDIGDLIWQDVDHAHPASDQGDQGSLILNQGKFADNFLGVAMQRSASGDTDPIRVATDGVFEFDCSSRAFELGDLVAAKEDTDNATLLDQTVIPTGVLAYGIGKVAKRQAAATTVLVKICSAVMGTGVDGASTYSGSGA